MQAEPAVVVEFEHDSAWERGRFRHPTTFVRLRTELRPSDLSPLRAGLVAVTTP
jgi:hypothetical protein